MKKIRLLPLAFASLSLLLPARAATFDDIQAWVGTGANRAGFVVDWNDGKAAESLVWGYRWDGKASGLDMFQALVAADPRLFANLSTPGAFGVSVYGVGYDANGDGSGFGVTPSLTFDSGGLSVGSVNDLRSATDPADHWQEGWNAGFWGYYVKTSAAEAWASAMSGSGDRVLSDGAWDGYSFAPGFSFTDPSEPAAATMVPEPGSLTLLIFGGILLVCVRQKRG